MTKKAIADNYPVTLEEVAARLGTTQEALRPKLDGLVSVDWAGRACIPASIARGVVEAAEREAAEHETREAQRLQRISEWEAARRALFREVFDEEVARLSPEAEAAARSGFAAIDLPAGFGRMDPRVRARAQEAAMRAIAEWESRNPRPE